MTRRRLPTSTRRSSGTRSKAGAPLVTLSPDELYRVKQQKRLLDDALMTASMLQCSYRTLWRALQEKYGLPAEVELDEATGRVFRRGKRGA